MANKNWHKIFLFFLLYSLFFYVGFITGIIYQQRIMFVGLGEALSYSDIEINVDINETLMVDRVTENMEPILWEARMKNCTKTEKGYCALECYENNKRIPCENFTGTEVFCSDGICKINGGCPTYYERLRGKTLTDCIKEVEANKSKDKTNNSNEK